MEGVAVGGISWSTGDAAATTMVPMRTPDEDGTQDGDGIVSSSLGEGFGSSAIEFGEDDFSDDFSVADSVDDSSDDSSDSDDSFDLPGDDSDELSDAEAENVLEQILEDVFGDDAPEVLDEVDSQAFRPDAGEMFESLDGAYEGSDAGSGLGLDLGGELDGGGFETVPDDFDPAEALTESDFDLTGDGHVNAQDLHEAAHPFDFDISN